MAKRLTEADYNKMDNTTLIATIDALSKAEYTGYVAPKVKVRYFVSKYGKGLSDALKGTGLFFSSTVAQKMAESEGGKSTLASQHNNFGGIKALAGYPKILMDTTESRGGKIVHTQDYFAKFPTSKDGFDAYVRVLKNNLRYAKVFTASSPEEQIKEMVKAGYSTMSPSAYLNNIQGTINRVRDMYPIGKIA